ncbi:hypothetical protein FB451DRAFT_1409638 [Mycena latifolia]|nr:hypothetical protein FB451DRAFT_1409638 [Mycena latifolia]
MFLPVFSVLAVVALGPQVVRASFKFSFSSVAQCEPVDISYSGGDANNRSVPTTLTILPLIDNTPPIRIPIPNGAANSTGIRLNFIPLPEGTLFIASLDDISGPLAKVSDVTKIAPPTNPAVDQTCFGTGPPSVNFYEFNDTVSQCEPFTIGFNTSVAPSIRAFLPRDGSTLVPPVNDTNATPGTASYMMNVNRGEEVVLLFDDGAGNLQTTKQITVGGDSSSSSRCFNKKSGNSKSGSSKTSSSALPQAAIIGIAVGASVIGLAAILILLYLYRERRRKRRVSHMQFDPALLNRRWPPDEKQVEAGLYNNTAPMSAPPPFSAGGFVHDPIYATDENYATSIMSDARTSIGSWNQFVPADQRSEQMQPSQRDSGESRSASRLSMNTLDIQDILQMATVHRGRSRDSGSSAPEAPQPSTAGTAATFNVAKPAVARLVSLRRRTSDPPDMPVLTRDDSARAAAVEGVPAGYGPSSYNAPSAYNGPTSYMSFESDDGHSVNRDDGHSVDHGDGSSGIGGYPVPAFRQPANPRDTSESWGNIVVR